MNEKTRCRTHIDSHTITSTCDYNYNCASLVLGWLGSRRDSLNVCPEMRNKKDYRQSTDMCEFSARSSNGSQRNRFDVVCDSTVSHRLA